MTNIALQRALNLLEKHSFPFVAGNESDFLIARNSAIHEINFERDKADMFEVQLWNDVYEEIMNISYEKYCRLN